MVLRAIRHLPGSDRGPQTGKSGMCFLSADGSVQGQIPCTIVTDTPAYTHMHTLKGKDVFPLKSGRSRLSGKANSKKR